MGIISQPFSAQNPICHFVKLQRLPLLDNRYSVPKTSCCSLQLETPLKPPPYHALTAFSSRPHHHQQAILPTNHRSTLSLFSPLSLYGIWILESLALLSNYCSSALNASFIAEGESVGLGWDWLGLVWVV
jgi:hypothetical protein